jgi:hypothetical protein
MRDGVEVGVVVVLMGKIGVAGAIVEMVKLELVTLDGTVAKS